MWATHMTSAFQHLTQSYWSLPAYQTYVFYRGTQPAYVRPGYGKGDAPPQPLAPQALQRESPSAKKRRVAAAAALQAPDTAADTTTAERQRNSLCMASVANRYKAAFKGQTEAPKRCAADCVRTHMHQLPAKHPRKAILKAVDRHGARMFDPDQLDIIRKDIAKDNTLA
ncbi:hypothetical protein B484DRAFT_467260 [Ochromonadaceae sp. CCMP2298]|nr:hypothetical protein B484DRAFT_467260 [Ochromonadaceae sp. CCMP2298]